MMYISRIDVDMILLHSLRSQCSIENTIIGWIKSKMPRGSHHSQEGGGAGEEESPSHTRRTRAKTRTHTGISTMTRVTCTPERIFSATDTSLFPSKNEFLQHALTSLEHATHHQELIYTHVPQDWGRMALMYLDERAEHTGARYASCSHSTILPS